MLFILNLFITIYDCLKNIYRSAGFRCVRTSFQRLLYAQCNTLAISYSRHTLPEYIVRFCQISKLVNAKNILCLKKMRVKLCERVYVNECHFDKIHAIFHNRFPLFFHRSLENRIAPAVHEIRSAQHTLLTTMTAAPLLRWLSFSLSLACHVLCDCE